MPGGSISPMRSNLDEFQVKGTWTGGGAAANCSRAAADWSRGIASVNYNAATGKYIITLVEGAAGEQLLPGSNIVVHRAAAAIPLLVNLIRGAFDADAGTVTFEVWAPSTEAVASALTDLALTDTISITLCMAPQAVYE